MPYTKGWHIYLFFHRYLPHKLSLHVVHKFAYCKVASSRLSRLVAHFHIFRLFMKGNFDAYVLWPLDKMVQNWIVYRSTARDFTVTVLLTIPFNKLLCVNKSLKKMNIFQNTIEESGCFWNQNKLCYENYDFIFIYLTHFFSLPENHALPYTEYYYNHQ